MECTAPFDCRVRARQLYTYRKPLRDNFQWTFGFRVTITNSDRGSRLKMYGRGCKARSWLFLSNRLRRRRILIVIINRFSFITMRLLHVWRIARARIQHIRYISNFLFYFFLIVFVRMLIFTVSCWSLDTRVLQWFIFVSENIILGKPKVLVKFHRIQLLIRSGKILVIQRRIVLLFYQWTRLGREPFQKLLTSICLLIRLKRKTAWQRIDPKTKLPFS